MTENAVEPKSSRRRRKAEEAAQEEVEVVETATLTEGKGRATPGRRNQADEKEEGNVVTRSAGGLREYFSDVRSELEKVAWPTREEALRLTRVVIIVLIISAIVMGVISFLFQQYVAFGLNNPIVFVVLMIAAVLVATWYFRTQDSTRSRL